MSGLIAQKQYDWKDSNLALFGSDDERQVKKDSAETEKAWEKAGQEVGVQIWRIVNFQVTDWPKEDYGKFYNGDSYIVLNTYMEENTDKFLYDVHFWIGKHSTQDEYGTAAYKTVELDTYLDDVPVQHREVQGYESPLFKSYFKTITIMDGGADSGFKQVKPENYKPRLFHFHGDKNHVEVRQIPRCRSLLDSTDVYILDMGMKIYQWNGNGSNVQEKTKAMQYVHALAEERCGKAVKKEVIDEHATRFSHEFYRALDEDASMDDVEDTPAQSDTSDSVNQLYRLSDETGDLTFTKEKEGEISKSDFDGKDVFIMDTMKELFVWIGSQTTQMEKLNALVYAHRYLQKCDHPFVTVTCLTEGKTTSSFDTALAA